MAFHRHPRAVQPYPPAFPEQLLGTLMSNATVGGVYARFNINTAPLDALKAVFSDADAQLIINRRGSSSSPTRIQGAFPYVQSQSASMPQQLLLGELG